MEKVIIKATKRDITGKQVRALRRTGVLPAVIYGHNIKPINITLNTHDATLVLNRTTASSLITIDLDGKEYPTLVREKQRNPVKDVYLHVDFQAVSMTEKIRAKVAVQLVGYAPAVKEFDAILVTGYSELEVEALPQDLPERIPVDISGLMNIGDGIHVRDIAISDKFIILDDVNEMIVLATHPRAEEVEEEVVEEVEALEEGEEPEVLEKGRKEEEPEEGAS